MKIIMEEYDVDDNTTTIAIIIDDTTIMLDHCFKPKDKDVEKVASLKYELSGANNIICRALYSEVVQQLKYLHKYVWMLVNKQQ